MPHTAPSWYWQQSVLRDYPHQPWRWSYRARQTELSVWLSSVGAQIYYNSCHKLDGRTPSPGCHQTLVFSEDFDRLTSEEVGRAISFGFWGFLSLLQKPGSPSLEPTWCLLLGDDIVLRTPIVRILPCKLRTSPRVRDLFWNSTSCSVSESGPGHSALSWGSTRILWGSNLGTALQMSRQYL